MLAPGILEGSESGLGRNQGAGTEKDMSVRAQRSLTLSPLLHPEAQGGENEGCAWKDSALPGPFPLFLLCEQGLEETWKMLPW